MTYWTNYKLKITQHTAGQNCITYYASNSEATNTTMQYSSNGTSTVLQLHVIRVVQILYGLSVAGKKSDVIAFPAVAVQGKDK